MTPLTGHAAVVSEADKIYDAINSYAPEWKQIFRKHIAAAVERVCEEREAAAFETAKDIYRTIHSGGCRMFSVGLDCTCFLCLIDEARAALNPKPDEVSK
jgi:hypothetical protein